MVERWLVTFRNAGGAETCFQVEAHNEEHARDRGVIAYVSAFRGRYPREDGARIVQVRRAIP